MMKETENEQTGTVIGTIPKGEGEQITISKKEYKGFKYVDIRLFFKDSENAWKPTKKGVTVGANKLDVLIGMLSKAK